MPAFVCNICKAKLRPCRDGRPKAWTCPKCRRAQALIEAAHRAEHDHCKQPVESQGARVARYAAVVAAGGRIFE